MPVFSGANKAGASVRNQSFSALPGPVVSFLLLFLTSSPAHLLLSLTSACCGFASRFLLKSACHILIDNTLASRLFERMSAVAPSALSAQGHSARHSARQTRTNPSRTSKTLGRSSFAYGHGLMEDPTSSPVPHGFYPALTHFTDAITALPREFRRHNSLLKEVDAKAWALEDNLLQLLKDSSETPATPYPANPAPVIGGVVRDDLLPTVSQGQVQRKYPIACVLITWLVVGCFTRTRIS